MAKKIEERNYFLVYHSIMDRLLTLPDKDFKEVFKAVWKFSETGTDTTFDNLAANYAYQDMKEKIIICDMNHKKKKRAQRNGGLTRTLQTEYAATSADIDALKANFGFNYGEVVQKALSMRSYGTGKRTLSELIVDMYAIYDKEYSNEDGGY